MCAKLYVCEYRTRAGLFYQNILTNTFLRRVWLGYQSYKLIQIPIIFYLNVLNLSRMTLPSKSLKYIWWYWRLYRYVHNLQSYLGNQHYIHMLLCICPFVVIHSIKWIGY